MVLKVIVIGALVIAINLFIQGFGSIFWFRRIVSSTKSENSSTNRFIFRTLLLSSLLFTLTHLVHSLIWALCYYVIPETADQFSSFPEAVYFSLVTFTTLGYGDISLSSNWRLLSGLEAVNGIMLIGWSTAMMFSLVQNFYKKINAIDD